MGRVKTRPEIWPDPRVFWPTRPEQFFQGPEPTRSNIFITRANFAWPEQPECGCRGFNFSDFLHFSPIFGQFWLFFCCWLYFCYQKCKIFLPEFGPNLYLLTRRWPEKFFFWPEKKSKNPRPDPSKIKKPETRPTPTVEGSWHELKLHPEFL